MNYTATLPIGGLSYVRGSTELQLINKTVGNCLDATAQKFPDQEALVVNHENVRLTYAQLKEEVGANLEPSKWAGTSPRLSWLGGATRGVTDCGAGCWGCPRTPKGIRS